ncbi:5750_t:CDS:2 [Entrophospora sp. SA101]|nr:5750_t:CDS:2 [Entrophospora sp. SA101]
MVKRMRSDAVPLSPEDYKFIIQYRDAKPKTEVLKELRKKYPMTNDRFYRIWRGQEVNYDYDPIEDLRLQFEQLGINQAKMARIIHAVLKSSQYKCSKCGKAGHNSRNCSKKKSKSRRSNKSISKKKVKQKGKSSSKKIPKSRKTKQKGVATSSKAQNKSTTLEENIRRIMLDMLEKVLLPHQLEKLKPENKNLAIPDFPSVSDQISQEVDSNEGGNEPLEDEWHAPAGFSLDSDNLTLKKNE